MTFNRDVHHRRSIRLPDYDYSRGGAYFVTLCAWQHKCFFAEIVDGERQLSAVGQIAHQTWEWLGDQYDHVQLDEWVVMPNHLHGIIVINEGRNAKAGGLKSLGRLIGAFKTVSTKRINELRHSLGSVVWQRNYYERVIRNEHELAGTREYIVNNPMKWELDKENPINRP